MEGTYEDAKSRVLYEPGVSGESKVSVHLLEVKVSSYIAQYPILRIAQSALHFTSLAVLFNQHHIWEACSYMLQIMREGYSHTYQSLVYSQVFIYTAE